ncbi:MAG: ABC transporter ATP-binding protein [Phycisphaerae bacterium]|nr:ABC transporter ATP-binding protein [Phycisphaerae bacterium]
MKLNDPDRPETKVALELRGVSKSYCSESGSLVQALDGVGLTVQEGEFVVLIGPTGCGKTTLLNIAAGLLAPDSGQVLLGKGLRQGDNIPCVFQHYTLFPWRTLLHNVTFGLEMRSIARHDRNDTARALIAKVGLSGFEGAYPHELSGGMRQRGAIAQALAIKPKLLLMDEPFGALDDYTRMELQQMLIDLWQESQITVLFVTHNIDEAVVMGDRVIVFSERPGKVIKKLQVKLSRPRRGLSQEFTKVLVELRQSLGGYVWPGE